MIAAEAGHGRPHDRGLSPWRRRPPTNEIAQATVALRDLRAREDAWARTDPLHRQLCTDVVRREILTLAGWITLLIACVEYDSGNRQAAETTRQAALSLGNEADHAEIRAWAHEIRAWIDLTTGNYHGVVAAARSGIEAAPHHSVAIQLSAQEAKAWAASGIAGARGAPMGDRPP